MKDSKEPTVSKSDLEKLSYPALIQLRADMDDLIQKRFDEERQKAREKAEELAREHGFTLRDLAPSPAPMQGNKPPSKQVKGRIKYRHPNDPTLEWTGKGRRPKWILEAQEAGQDIEQWRVDS